MVEPDSNGGSASRTYFQFTKNNNEEAMRHIQLWNILQIN